MSWHKVTSVDELKVGDRVRYGSLNRGVFGNLDKRYVTSVLPFEVHDNSQELCTSHFDTWEVFEVWRDDNARQARPAQTKPVHRGYEWDGVVYTFAHINGKLLTEHDKLIADARATLAKLNLQRRRYSVLAKRGLE